MTRLPLPPPPPDALGWPWIAPPTTLPASGRPTISIVTANLNQGSFLETALRSVLLQDYPDIEYSVIDGGSSDGSIDIIRRYAAHLAFWTSEPDRGQSHALNKGFARATGDILGWLNADDLYLPGTLERVATIFREDSSVGLIYGNCLVHDLTTGQQIVWPRFRPPGLPSLLVEGNGIPQPSAFVRRSVVQRVGLLDESLHLVMDYDLWLRITLVAAVRCVNDPLSIVREHPATKTRRFSAGFLDEYLRVVNRFYARSDVPTPALEARSKALARLLYARAEMAALSERRPLSALFWFLRAVRHDPKLVVRIPRAMRKGAARRPRSNPSISR